MYEADVQVVTLAGYTSEKNQNLLFQDGTLMSLGITTIGVVMTVLVKSNKTVRTKKPKMFSTYSDNLLSDTTHTLF